MWGHCEKPNFRFCGDRAAPGRPYCETHCRKAYVRIKTPEELRAEGDRSRASGFVGPGDRAFGNLTAASQR